MQARHKQTNCVFLHYKAKCEIEIYLFIKQIHLLLVIREVYVSAKFDVFEWTFPPPH